MQRTINDEEKDLGLMFACSNCGNTEFYQDCFAKIVEIINIMKKDKEITIVSKYIHEDSMDDIEYSNDFKCPKCKTEYDIIRRDGEDVVLQIGFEEGDVDE